MTTIRPAGEGDLAAMQAIYAHHVLHGLGTFEETPPSAEEMGQRLTAIRAQNLPWLAAEVDGRVLGYGYAGLFRPRAAYRFTVEDSVYVSPEAVGQGLGKALLMGVIAACEAKGLRQIIAVIGDSGNAASIGLHRACNFELKAVLPALGWKFGRWVDVVWMQRRLNGGEVSAPEDTAPASPAGH